MSDHDRLGRPTTKGNPLWCGIALMLTGLIIVTLSDSNPITLITGGITALAGAISLSRWLDQR